MLTSVVVFVLASFVGTKAFEWTPATPEDNVHVYTCDGNNVSFPWDFQLDNDTEKLIHIKWFEQGNVVASYAAGHFFTDSSNVEHVPLAGLRVNGVKVNSTFSVTVDVSNSSVLTSYICTAHVLPAEPPKLVNGQLELEPEPSVMMDEATGQWFVELRCGHFISLGHPPVTARWMTPSGQEMNSSGYHHGSFVLNLPPDHVDTGDYTCSLDNTGTDQALDCLPPLHAQRSLYVDGKEMLVKVLEEEKGVLKDRVHEMKDRLQQSQTEVDSLRKNGTEISSQIQDCLMSITHTHTHNTHTHTHTHTHIIQCMHVCPPVCIVQCLLHAVLCLSCYVFPICYRFLLIVAYLLPLFLVLLDNAITYTSCVVPFTRRCVTFSTPTSSPFPLTPLPSPLLSPALTCFYVCSTLDGVVLLFFNLSVNIIFCCLLFIFHFIFQ